MKIVALSDIHLDINNARKDKNFGKQLVSYLSSLNGDILVLTGDIAGRTSDLVEFLEATQDLHFTHKMYVPGNHDIWVNQSSENLSSVKYYEILPEISNSFGWEFLPNNPLIIDNNVFLGTMGWYDYSSRNKIWDDVFTINQYQKKVHPTTKTELMDRHFVRFGKTDQEIAKQLNAELHNDFEFVMRRISLTEIDNFIILTHMVPFEQFIPYRGLLRYDFFTAYFGNLNLGDLIKREVHDVNCYAIFGQTHIPNIKQLQPNLKGYCVPIGYPREYGTNIALSKLFDNRVKTIEM